MTREEHKQKHIELHKCLSELAADYIFHTGKFLSDTTLSDFLTWSYEQTLHPTEQYPCKECGVDGLSIPNEICPICGGE